MKRIFLIFMMICFAFVLVNAQGNKKETCWSEYQEGPMICNGDYFKGELQACVTEWESGKFQFKVKALYYGASGSVYEFSNVENLFLKPNVSGGEHIFSRVATAVFYKDGVEFAIWKVRVHFTQNANGEVVVDRYEETGWVCLE